MPVLNRIGNLEEGAEMARGAIKPGITKIIEYFAARLEENGVKVSKIVVFGSQAGGKTHDDSDIDLVIVSDSFKQKDLFQRAEMIGRAYEATVEEFLMPMDILMETPEEFNPDFGVVVYAA